MRLHSSKGVNPFLTVCRTCGKDVGVALVGAHTGIYKCRHCDCHNIGGRPDGDKCPKCGFIGFDKIRDLKDGEKLPIEVCDECQKKDEECAEVVRLGGVYWRCRDCHSSGALKSESELAKRVRRSSGVEPPAPVGIEFDKDHFCPVCEERKKQS